MRRFLYVLNTLEEWTLVLLLLGLAFLSFVEMLCRYLLNFSFGWMQELARYLGVFIAFLGASLGVKYGTHFSMDLLYERVSNDRFRHSMRFVVCILSAALFLVVAWYGWDQTMKLRHFRALTASLELPKYWAYLPIPFFSVFISLRFLIVGGRHFRGAVRNEPYGSLGEKK